MRLDVGRGSVPYIFSGLAFLLFVWVAYGLKAGSEMQNIVIVGVLFLLIGLGSQRALGRRVGGDARQSIRRHQADGVVEQLYRWADDPTSEAVKYVDDTWAIAKSLSNKIEKSGSAS